MGDTSDTLVGGDIDDGDGCHRRRRGVTPVTKKGDTSDTQTLCKNTDLSNTLKENTAAPSARDDWPENYKEAFWQSYPLKISRKAVDKKLESVRKNDNVSWANLMAGIKKIDRSYIPSPVKWLNEGRWDDETTASDLQRRVSPRL
jgi:hypothetical protein